MSKENLNQQVTRRDFFREAAKYAVVGIGSGSVFWWGLEKLSKAKEESCSNKSPNISVETPTPTAISQEVLTPTPRGQYYEVKKGDNLYRIALQFGTTVKALAEANQIDNPQWIYPGQILYLVSHAPSMTVVHDLLSPEQRLAADLSYEGIYYHSGELNSAPERQQGLVHVYGLGEPLNPNYATGFPFQKEEFGCASWFYPLGTWLRVTNLANEEIVYCRVKDRGPNRVSYPTIIADLTKGARDEIAPSWVGEIKVVIEPAK